MREIDMRRWWLCGLLVLLLLLTSPAGAREILQGDQCLVPARETIDDDLFVLCRTLEIDGVVTGNVLGIATTAEIDGRIGGNLYLAAGQLDVTGSIGENLHFFGAALRLSADARFEDERADILSLGLSTTLERGAQLPDGIIGAGYQLVVDGNVGGDIDYWGSALHITGSVAGDIDASVGDSQSAGVPQL
jgi:cytoskeletal protein CcmA (bactofilin family)